MALWWIGNIIFLLVVIPVVVVLLRRLREPVLDIAQHAADALAREDQVISALDAVDDLEATRSHARKIKSEMTRYGRALDQIL